MWRAAAGLVVLLGSREGHAQEGDAFFRLDPVTDSALTGGTLLIAAMSEAMISTGEVEAQLPDGEAKLLWIDRWVAERPSPSNKAIFISDVGILTAFGWAVADTTLAATGGRGDSGLTFGVLYLESLGTTWLVSNLFKLAVRRPRPRAYMELREYGKVSPKTQESLSFFSMHTAFAASIGATATYLAFARGAPAWESWTIFGGAVVGTSVVGVGRLFAGAHFTTDVIAGAAAGTAIGLLVPHFHRIDRDQPASGNGGTGMTAPQFSLSLAW